MPIELKSLDIFTNVRSQLTRIPPRLPYGWRLTYVCIPISVIQCMWQLYPEFEIKEPMLHSIANRIFTSNSKPSIKSGQITTHVQIQKGQRGQAALSSTTDLQFKQGICETLQGCLCGRTITSVGHGTYDIRLLLSYVRHTSHPLRSLLVTWALTMTIPGNTSIVSVEPAFIIFILTGLFVCLEHVFGINSQKKTTTNKQITAASIIFMLLLKSYFVACHLFLHLV